MTLKSSCMKLFLFLIFLYSRHNQGLISWFAQESINKHRGAGEVVNVPGTAFIGTEPVEGEEVFTITKTQTALANSLH